MEDRMQQSMDARNNEMEADALALQRKMEEEMRKATTDEERDRIQRVL